MKARTKDLIGPALDWAVAKAEGNLGHYVQPNEKRGTTQWEVTPSTRRYSTNWAHGGPIAERELIGSSPPTGQPDSDWVANRGRVWARGPTELTAKMRCLVASKLGDEIDVPEELLS